MKTESISSSKTVKVGTQEQQENVTNTRKTLKVLQQTATDKENLTGRSIFKENKMAVDQEVKRKKLIHKSIQTEDLKIDSDDLTNDEPSENYWRITAEKREEALNNSLQENARLQDKVHNLEEENRICKEMLNESKSLINVLQEIINEVHDTSAEVAEEAEEEN
ncbi:geminin [Holotrichia oblita]|uniref:Geminin n=1 Tax=Holotrichia oblita TaxID=644536 RepID=A0ACB9SMW1_HOLOL|nr:geminin [Holotrichia oblita]